MSSGPFRSLSDIFAEGAEQSLGLAYYFGYSHERIDRIIDDRFGPLSPSDRELFTSFAQNGVDSARRLSGRTVDDSVTAADFPTNPFLYGDDPGGNRVRVIGVIEFPDSGAIIRVYQDFEDIPSVRDLIDALENKGSGIGERYPTKFGLDPTQDIRAIVVDYAFVEKWF